MRRTLTLLLTAALATACAADAGPTGSADGPHAVPGPGDLKADNYISTNAREFTLSGDAHVTLPANFADLDGDARAAELQRLAEAKLPSISRAVRDHVEKVLAPFNEGTSGEEKRWFTYYKRDHATAGLPTPLDDTRAVFTFEMELVGSPFLMSKLDPEETGGRTFEVEVKDSWWDAAGAGELVTVSIEASESRDAFPKYDELFADGVLDIAVHFGGDYNEERFDISTAKWLTEHLLEDEDWTHPTVTTFETLGIDSGPFTRKLLVEGKEIEARITIVHSDMVEAAEEQRLSEAMKASLGGADIVVYAGHAGENAGFILDYQPRHEIKASEFATLALPEKYQIYVFDGCRTYRTYVDDMLANPAKTFANLDIVTTINTTPFSVGYQVLWEILYWFTLTDGAGNHYPLSWKAILRGINTDAFYSVHYGVHGIDNDPQLNPHGSEGIACRPCAADTDCGAGGNMCLGYATGAACGVACTNDSACPDGYRCARITEDDDLFYLPKQCLKQDYDCSAAQ